MPYRNELITKRRDGSEEPLERRGKEREAIRNKKKRKEENTSQPMKTLYVGHACFPLKRVNLASKFNFRDAYPQTFGLAFCFMSEMALGREKRSMESI